MLGNLGDQLRQVALFEPEIHLTLLGPGELAQVRSQTFQATRLTADGTQKLDVGGEDSVDGAFGISLDGGQRRAQLMGDFRDEAQSPALRIFQDLGESVHVRGQSCKLYFGRLRHSL